jgi:enoyl-CoA hydratase/carnithine racemase
MSSDSTGRTTTLAATSKLTLAVADGVATISLNRPERHNAVDDELRDGLFSAWDTALADPAARVILLRGEGRSFCSGRDTSELGRRPNNETDLAFIRHTQDVRVKQLGSHKPIVAALRGHVLGGGLELALAADIRIAAADLRMAFPEIRYGLMSDTGGAPLATMLAGPSRAKWMLMTGRPVDAERALAWGLVDEVVAPEEVDGVAAALAREIATAPADALALIKQTVDGLWHGALHAALRQELAAQAVLFAERSASRRPDAKAGS